MPEVRVRAGESIDRALRRFKRLCREDFREMKRRRHYVKPSESRRKRKTRGKSRKTQ
jgi:small subunit ribosomal protein S21